MEYLNSVINTTFQMRAYAVNIVYCIFFVFIFVAFLTNV
jgi:hypothetical protein